MTSIRNTSSPALLDPEVFAELIELLGSERVRSLLVGLAERLNGPFWSGHSACADRKLIADEAHKLVSAAGMFGLMMLSDSCARLEIAATNDQVDLVSVLTETRDACRVAMTEIGARLNGPSF